MHVSKQLLYPSIGLWDICNDQPFILLFLLIMLCCSCAQCYAQEQELWSEYYAIYIQVCMNKLLFVVDNFRKTILLECIYE